MIKTKMIPIVAVLICAACNNAADKSKNTTDTSTAVAKTENSRHGWLGTETVKSRLGDFEFKNGYPTDEALKKLNDAFVYSRAIEAYMDQMHAVSWYAVWKGVSSFAPAKPNQIVIWESLMDAQTLLLTGNTETVYGLAGFDLRDGPLVIEVPP